SRREREPEPLEKRFDEMIIAAARQRLAMALEIFTPPLKGQLQRDEFIQGEAGARFLHLTHLLREMDLAQRPGPVWQIRQADGGPGIIELPHLEQRAPDETAQPTLRQALRQRINRHDAVNVDRTV